MGHYTRDNARTPFQWSCEENGGFTKGKPWLNLNPNYKTINAESQVGKEDSIYSFYQKLIRLRKNPQWQETIVYGETVPILEKEENLMAYYRKGEGQTILVLGNFSGDEKNVNLAQLDWSRAQILLSNDQLEEREKGRVTLQPWQCAVIGISQ